MKARLLGSSLGMSLTVGDMYLCRREEKEFILKNPKDLTTGQLLYLLCRYTTLIFQILDIAIFSFDSHKSAVAAKLFMHPCLLHAVFKALAGYVIFLLLHLILTLRVYALYNKSLWLAFLFGFSCCIRVLACIYDITSRIKHGIADHNLVSYWFDDLCFPRLSFPRDPGIACFFLIELVTHFMLCCLTLRKTLQLEGGWSFRASSVGSVLNRDALVILPSIFAVVIGIVMIKPLNVSFFMFPICLVVPSCLGCHAIVGMQRLGLGDPSASKDSEEIQFSTVDATWDYRTHLGV